MLILVDSGSSASFVGNHIKHEGLKTQMLEQPIKVRVADGGELLCDQVVSNCEWWC